MQNKSYLPPVEVDVEDAQEAVNQLIRYLGEDPGRDGLCDTSARVCKALLQMTTGYSDNPKEILGRVFQQDYDEVIMLTGIEFTSLCEHHLLPFIGTVDIGYIPGKVVGISKLARLVECFSKRLQIQERMTKEIAESIQQHLEAKGVMVVVTSAHMCMSCRGVKKSGTLMKTSVCLGAFRDCQAARQEFLSLMYDGRNKNR